MTIKFRSLGIFSTMLTLLVAIVVVLGLDSAAQRRVADAQLNRFQSNKLADQLRQSSDDLTRMARTYVVTGNPTYEQYFFNILAIRDGTAPRPQDYQGIYWDYVTASGERPASPGRPAALIDLMRQVGLSGEELAMLSESKKNSDDLTNLEKTAFGAMKGLFADGLGNLTIRRKPDPEFAREILYSSEYYKAKAEIMRPIGEFMKLVDQRTDRELEAVRSRDVFYRITAYALTIAAILVAVLAFFHVKRRVVDPIVSLATTAQHIKQGRMDERATISSLDELGVLYDAFNSMVERTQDAITELAEANAELDAFAYSVSHDLRAPLRSMDGFSQVMLEDYSDKLDDEGRHHLERIRHASQTMSQLIDDLLALARLKRAEFDQDQVDLSGIAEAVSTSLQDRNPDRDVVFDIAPGLGVEGDGRLLRIVLENLLGNAWKFTSKHPQATIEFGVTESDGQPAYYVRDDGIGFDMAHAENLFQAFQRLHSTTDFEGTGIGLATVARIVRRHGGQVWADASPGAGATIYFTLPTRGE